MGHVQLVEHASQRSSVLCAFVSDMRTQRSDGSPSDWRAVVLAAHLVHTSNTPHAGFFLGSYTVQQKIDTFLKHSSYAAGAVLDGSLEVVIVHDVPQLKNLSSYRKVSLQHIQRATRLAPNDFRWEAYGVALHELALPQRTCVFAIDFGDVAPTRDLRELCATQRNALFAGSDNCATPGVSSRAA